VSLVIIGAVLFTMREPGHDTRVGTQHDGAVSNTYVLSDLRVSPLHGNAEPTVRVTGNLRWSSNVFPGSAPCTVTLLARDGHVITTDEEDVMSMTPDVTLHTRPIPVGQQPASASGRCGPGVLGDPDARYVFNDLRVEGAQIVGQIGWEGGDPGEAACAYRITPPNSPPVIDTFTLGAPDGQQLSVHVDGLHPSESSVVIACEQYRTPDQLEPGYWSPWPGTGT
jgi:hypothetical protein